MKQLGQKGFWEARRVLPRISGSTVTQNLRNKPSKNFVTANKTAISSGDAEHVSIKHRKPEAEKFAPFSDMIVRNKSDCDIEIWVNQDSGNVLNVSANQTIAFGENELGGSYSTYSIYVVNGVSTEINDIKVQHFHRGATSEKALNKAVRIIGGGF